MKKINLGLRNKILIYFGIIIIFLIIILYFIISTITYMGFENIEAYEGQKNVMRVIEAIDNDGQSLEGVCSDYAYWDATYDLVEGTNLHYSEVDLTDETLVRFNLNYLIITDINGDFVYFRHYDGENISSEPTNYDITNIKNEKSFFIHKYSNGSMYGTVLLPSGPALFASSNIYRSDSSGDTVGSMIMIQNIDDKYIDKLSQQTKLDVRILPHNIVNSAAYANILTGHTTNLLNNNNLTLNSKYTFNIIDNQHSSIETVINDIDEKPLFLLRVISSREMYFQVKDIISLFFMSIIIICVLLYATLYVLLENAVFSRISRITYEIKQISESKDLKKRITMMGADELGNLIKSFNDNMDVLEIVNKEKNAIFDANPDTLLMIDAEGKITTKKIAQSLIEKKEFFESKTTTPLTKEETSKVQAREFKDFFSDKNIITIRVSALDAIKNNNSSIIELIENSDSKMNYFEARIYSTNNNQAIVIVREVTNERQNIELLKLKNAESEKFNKLSIDRELKMIELKKKLSELETKEKKST